MMGMTRSRLLISVVGLVAIFVPCAIAAPATFVSHLYHYSVRVPPGFHAHAATIPIAPGFFPTMPGPGTDEFIQGKNSIGAASQPIGAQVSLSSWTKSRIAVIRKSYGCEKPKETHAVRIAGVRALELVYPDCQGEYTDSIEAVHGGRGYDVYWFGAAEPGTLLRDLASFRFTN
jgi:hypothetical protein